MYIANAVYFGSNIKKKVVIQMKKFMAMLVSILFVFAVSSFSFAQNAPATPEKAAPKMEEKKTTEKKTTKKKKSTKKHKTTKKTGQKPAEKSMEKPAETK